MPLVDVIHNDSIWLGSFAKSGHFDFYVGEETEQEKKFGYDQPGTKECFIGSHSIAKDIFAATIKSECEIVANYSPPLWATDVCDSPYILKCILCVGIWSISYHSCNFW